MFSIPALPVLTLPFPAIDPVIVSIGPFAIRWYALAYIVGLIAGWRMVLGFNAGPDPLMSRKDIDDFLVWMALGVVLGGRLGYVLFYQPGHYFSNPGEILAVWKGGMSFHGGILGVIAAIVLFARLRNIPTFALGDQIARVTPLGLLLGRLANFVNGELYGRPSDVAWAMVFPHGGPAPRHPSQLYEALLEGAVLFALLWWLARRLEGKVGPGFLTGVFLVGYGITRSIAEFFREPDVFLGYFAAGTTMGQWLSLPMLIVGLWFMARARKAA